MSTLLEHIRHCAGCYQRWRLRVADCLDHEHEHGRGRMHDSTGPCTWDGDLKEYNNPLPKWWLNTFYLSIYVYRGLSGILYPWAWATFAGVLGWSQNWSVRRTGCKPVARSYEECLRGLRWRAARGPG